MTIMTIVSDAMDEMPSSPSPPPLAGERQGRGIRLTEQQLRARRSRSIVGRVR